MSFSLRSRAPTVGEQRANRVFVLFPALLANKVSYLPPIFRIKDRHRHRPGPSRKDGLPERRLSSRGLAVVGEDWLVSRQNPSHQNQVTAVIHAHANDLQPLRRILFR